MFSVERLTNLYTTSLTTSINTACVRSTYRLMVVVYHILYRHRLMHIISQCPSIILYHFQETSATLLDSLFPDVARTDISLKIFFGVILGSMKDILQLSLS